MSISDEDIQARREEVEALRAQLAEVEQERLEREADQSNVITMADLNTEHARLEAQLAQARANTVAAENGTSAPLQSALEQMKASVQQKEAAEAAVDATDPTVDMGARSTQDADQVAPLEESSTEGSTTTSSDSTDTPPPPPAPDMESTAPDAESQPTNPAADVRNDHANQDDLEQAVLDYTPDDENRS